MAEPTQAPEVPALANFVHFCRRNRQVIEHEYPQAREEEAVRCLGDLIALWVREGDAVNHCPTFEHYLRVVLQIIAVWSGEGRQWAPIVSVIFIPARDANDDLREGSQRSPKPLSTIGRQDCFGTIWNHPAFRRETFEYAQLKHARGTA